MRFFDVNAMLGAHFSPREGRFFTADDYLVEMDAFGIDDAVVYHGLAADFDAPVGNRQLLEMLQGRPRLHPCWIIAHPQYGLPDYLQEIEDGMRHGVQLVRLFWGDPLANLSVLDLDLLAGLLAALETRRLPVLLANAGLTEITGHELTQVKALCLAFPGLPVILSSPKTHRDFGLIRYLCEHCDNFHLDTSSIHAMGALEEIARRYGARHLIYGSNFPWFSAAQSRIALMYADLPEGDKAAIAGGNLRRLMEGVR